jgi:hypothetical protein
MIGLWHIVAQIDELIHLYTDDYVHNCSFVWNIQRSVCLQK